MIEQDHNKQYDERQYYINVLSFPEMVTKNYYKQFITFLCVFIMLITSS